MINSFRQGKYGTSFIPEQFPKGFKGVDLNAIEIKEVVSAAVSMYMQQSHMFKSANNFQFCLPTPVEGVDDEFIVSIVGKGMEFDVFAEADESAVIRVEMKPHNTSTSVDEPEVIQVKSLDWTLGSPIADIEFVGEKQGTTYTRAVQFEGMSNRNGFKLRMYGSQQEILVQSKRAHKLSQYMLAPEVKDVSKFLLCPMPGTLISLSVQEGQVVEAGQQLAVVEAMKMQNILRAEKTAKVSSIKSKAGSHLKVDQVILEFASL